MCFVKNNEHQCSVLENTNLKTLDIDNDFFEIDEIEFYDISANDFYDHVLELIVHPMISVQTNNGRVFQKQPNVNSEIKRKKEETNVNNYEVSGIKRQKTAACRTKTIVSDQIRDGYTIAERQINGERIVG